MSKPEKITIDGTEYVRSDSLAQAPKGSRAVVVIDRGWIFAGDVVEAEGRTTLHRPVIVLRWESIGFDGVIKDPTSSKVTLKKMSSPVDLPAASEIFRVPVRNDWGLE
jgi:hypothetical protein